MFKKTLVVTAILASTSAALAAGAGAPYVGASIGVDSTQLPQIDGVSGRNPNFNLFGGYGVALNPSIYLGGEAFVNRTTGSFSLFHVASVSNRYTYGASIIPGYKLSENTMLYVRGGIARTAYDIEGDREYSTGFQTGLGMQTNLTQNLDVRGEYVYSDYSGFGNSFKPTTDQFNLGLVYKFE